MDYEKKYKKLKADIEKAYLFAQTDSTKSVLEHILPELKESRDEKIKGAIIHFISHTPSVPKGVIGKETMLDWLEKQGEYDIDCPKNHQDSSRPNGCIVLEDFNGGEGFYKLNLDYLNKKQVEEVEEMVRTWNKESKTSNENIKNCIGMCLTDVNEQRFKDYNTNLRDCLAWLEKQGQKLNPIIDIEIPFGAKDSELQEATYLIPEGFHAEIEGDKVVIKKGKQKPAWTEEDENGLCDALWAIKQARTIAKDENDMGTLWYAERWLNTIKERVQSS